MKILYLHQYFNTSAMPGSTRSYEMAKRLVSWGHEVVMITSDREGKGVARRTVEDGIQVYWLGVPYANHMGYGARINSFFKFAWHAARTAASVRGDIVFASSTPLTIAIPGIYAARKQKIPMVFEVRDQWPELPVALGVLKNPLLIGAAKWLERHVYGFSSRIVALSPGMKEGIIRAGCEEKKVEVIPNSCDIELFGSAGGSGETFRRERAWLGDRPLVVYIGTLGKIHGVDYFVRLAEAAWKVDREVRFLIVGDGKEKENIARAAKESGALDRNLFMLPAVAKRDVPRILNASSVAVSITIDVKALWDNSANKFFDAFAAGRPVVINYQGWQADIINRTGAGIVLDARDTERAAAGLVSFLRDNGRMERARAASRDLAAREFSRDVLAKKLERVLLEARDGNKKN